MGRELEDGLHVSGMAIPEKTDHPRLLLIVDQSSGTIVFLITGASTNFGLKEEKEEKWRKQKELESIGDFVTSSKLTYK